MSVKPRLSIGIPVYNQASTIGETIQAALTQRSPAFEVVVSDNHSSDGTSEIVAEYADRVKVVRPSQHLPMTAHWNFCIENTTGDWVGLCSGDDQLLPNYVGSMTHAITGKENAVFIMGGWETHNTSNGTIEKRLLMSVPRICLPPKTLRMNLRSPKASFAAFCFSRSAFEKVGGYDETFHLVADWMLQFDLAPLGSFIKVNDVIAKYQISDRPNLSEERKPLFCRDLVRYARSKIWEARKYGISDNEITKAATRILMMLAKFVHSNRIQFSHDDAVEIENIASDLGCLDQWRKWKQDGVRSGRIRLITSAVKRSLANIRSLFEAGR